MASATAALGLVGLRQWCSSTLHRPQVSERNIFSGYDIILGSAGVRVGRESRGRFVFSGAGAADSRNFSFGVHGLTKKSSAQFTKSLQGEVRMEGMQNSSGIVTTDLVISDAETTQSTSNDSQRFIPGKADLLVVGPGVLGTMVAQEWFKVNEGECNVVGQTNTTNHHERLRSIGILPVTKDARQGEKFSNVIFCAPPSGSEDYAAEVRAAAERWNGEGSLLFTSSTALYAVSDNGVCDEETAPIVPKGAGPRTDRLHAAEEEILKVGGNVDAASLCVAILKGEFRGRVFLGCDNHPVSRQEIMDAVNKSGKYDKKFEAFTTTEDLNFEISDVGFISDSPEERYFPD
ncbi:hypothetical protein R1flu_015014 [Riccia fluitans]|uniref:Uncharacterized protein n=1 Tax=Riccia fluitans TaxID=41844 RepID=A0ABD1YI13_9MARC